MLKNSNLSNTYKVNFGLKYGINPIYVNKEMNGSTNEIGGSNLARVVNKDKIYLEAGTIIDSANGHNFIQVFRWRY